MGFGGDAGRLNEWREHGIQRRPNNDITDIEGARPAQRYVRTRVPERHRLGDASCKTHTPFPMPLPPARAHPAKNRSHPYPALPSTRLPPTTPLPPRRNARIPPRPLPKLQSRLWPALFRQPTVERVTLHGGRHSCGSQPDSLPPPSPHMTVVEAKDAVRGQKWIASARACHAYERVNVPRQGAHCVCGGGVWRAS